MKERAVIIIIAHKVTLSETEKASLQQCYKILGKHTIKIICPDGLDVSDYKNINAQADIVFINPKWQSSYHMFNELKKSDVLYKMFNQFEFMLFYELDAWVFKDELAFWCSAGYDYIGAPWFEGGFTSDKSNEVLPGGNGGFSLRKVSKHLQILERIEKLDVITRKLFLFKGFINAARKTNPFTGRMFLRYFLNDRNNNEDVFWCFKVGHFFKDFTIAPFESSAKFSFETRAAYLFRLNNNQLPFGCHSWRKFEQEFWKDHIFLNTEKLVKS